LINTKTPHPPTTIFIIDFLLSCVGVLLGVAFFTLIERKIIGLAHFRKGPTKVVAHGLSQPIGDAIKLLTKERTKITSLKIGMYLTGPLLRITLIIICWSIYDYAFLSLSTRIKVVVLFSLIGLASYRILLIRWGSNRKYATLGGHRAIAQVISYEVCIFLFFLAIAYPIKTINTLTIHTIRQGLWVAVFSLPLLLAWILLCIAESNRTPFDIAEGESEIVSGFNIEYGGGLFALIFIREYGIIIILRFLTASLFLGGRNFLIIKTFLICFIYVWVRVSAPRVRYDKLITTSWKVILPYRLTIILIGIIII